MSIKFLRIEGIMSVMLFICPLCFWVPILVINIIAAAQFGFTGTKGNVAQAAEKSMAQKPYMGWSSYSMQVYDGDGKRQQDPTFLDSFKENWDDTVK